MIGSLECRDPGLELLDGERLDPVELRLNLREMAMLNRLPGGVGTSCRAIRQLLGDERDEGAGGGRNGGRPRGSVLDIGTGSGDLPAALVTGDRDLDIEVIAADLRPEVLAVAERRLGGLRGVRLIQADVRDLPLADDAVDVAHASLVVHHLDPDGAVAALREMGRVARRGVVINDLRRSRLAFAATAATVLALSRGRYTRHDGVLSARRAYSLPELDELAAAAGLHAVWRSNVFLPRVVTAYR